MTFSHHDPSPCQWFARLAYALDRRSAPRLVLLFLGAVLARGRRAVTSGIRAVISWPSSVAHKSDRHVVRGPFLEAPPSLVVDLGGGHVPVAE